MSDLAISNAASLTAATLAGSDLVPILDVSAVVGLKGSQTTLDELGAYLVGNLKSTWNDAGTDFSLIYGRVTNTSSGASSKLIDVGTVAGGSLFSVSKLGYLKLPEGGFTTPSLCFAATTGISATGGTRLDFIVSGAQALTMDANGVNVYAPRLAATKFSFNPFGFTGPEIRSGAGSPEGGVTADPGSIYINSSGGPPYYKNTGTGNTGWVLMS